MAAFGDFLKTAWYNAKIIFGWNLAAAAGICILAFIIFDLNYLVFNDIAQIGELFLSTLGIMLFPGLGSIEGRTNSSEIIYVKMRSHLFIFLLRIILAAVLLFFLILGVVLFARLNNGSFDCTIVTCGVFISALYLGMIGLTVTNLQREPAPGYIAAFGYFMFEYFSRGKYTSRFYIFGLLNHDFNSKYAILFVSLLLLVINYTYIKYRYSRDTLA